MLFSDIFCGSREVTEHFENFSEGDRKLGAECKFNTEIFSGVKMSTKELRIPFTSFVCNPTLFKIILISC